MSKDTIEVPRELLWKLLDSHIAAKIRYTEAKPIYDPIMPSLGHIIDLYTQEIARVKALLNPPQPEPEEDPRQMHMEL